MTHTLVMRSLCQGLSALLQCVSLPLSSYSGSLSIFPLRISWLPSWFQPPFRGGEWRVVSITSILQRIRASESFPARPTSSEKTHSMKRCFLFVCFFLERQERDLGPTTKNSDLENCLYPFTLLGVVWNVRGEIELRDRQISQWRN